MGVNAEIDAKIRQHLAKNGGVFDARKFGEEYGYSKGHSHRLHRQFLIDEGISPDRRGLTTATEGKVERMKELMAGGMRQNAAAREVGLQKGHASALLRRGSHNPFRKGKKK